MNKLLTKIVGVVLGTTMAVGVGVGVAVNSDRANVDSQVNAAASTSFTGSSITFSNVSGIENSVQYTDWTGDEFSIKFGDGGNDGKYYSTGTAIRVYTNGYWQITPASGRLMTKIQLTFSSSSSGYMPTASTSTLSGGGSISYSGTVATWTGSTTGSVKQVRNSGSNHWRIQTISVTSSIVSSDPSITLSEETITINTADDAGKDVSVTPTSFGDGTKHYLWSTNDSNISLVNSDTDTVSIKPNTSSAGNATVNVKVWGGNVAEADALTDSVSVTIETPKTVAEALLLSGTSNVYTKGIVSRISEVSTANGNATYFISDDGTTTDELEVYRGKYIGNTNFTSEGQIQVGDTVVVFGNITTYNTVVEYAQGNYLISLKSEARLSLSPSTVEVTVGTDVEVTASPSNFESGTITYAFDEDNCATLSHVGNTITVHGDAVGSYTFTVTGQVGGVAQASAELVVTVVNPYPTNISRSGYASFTDAQTFADGTGSLTITYSDSSTATKHLGDIGVKLLISDVEVAASASTASYLGSNSAKISYTEEGHTVSTSAYTLNVNAELEVTSFEGVPEYLIIDSSDPLHSATITVNYKSLNGEPELSITSSNPVKLPVTFNEEDNIFEGTTGLAEFTITAGTSVGQYSVTASVTCGGRTESKSFSINVRGEAPASGDGKYVLVDSISDLETGEYVIAANVSSTYYGMTKTVSSSKFSSSTVTVSNGEITASAGQSFEYHISISGTGESRTATIYDSSSEKYVYYSSNTNVGTQANSYSWTISSGTKGTWRMASGTSGRALAFRASTYNVFGGYSTSNITSGGTEYYDVELFKYEEAQADSFELVNTFVANYMHMNDVSLGNNNDTGACRGETGYYLTAKKGWNSMATSYEGEDNLQTVFSTSFKDAYDRYLAWADACGDAAPFDGKDEIASANVLFKNAISSNTAAITTVVIISVISLSTLCGYFLLRKRKEQ